MELQYFATFPAGFECLVEGVLPALIPGARCEKRFGGAVLFTLDRKIGDADTVSCFTNVFRILGSWNSNTRDFSGLAKEVTRMRMAAQAKECVNPLPATFRLRFSRENLFVPVDKEVSKKLENQIQADTGMALDRLNPESEFWLFTRSEGVTFFALRIPLANSGSAKPRRGELKPELATLLVFLASPDLSARVFYDPCAGYGSIPAAVCRVYGARGTGDSVTVIAGDIDQDVISFLAERFAREPSVRVINEDATIPGSVPDDSVDAIVTDPPWGEWEEGSLRGEPALSLFYSAFLQRAEAVLVPGGRLVVLSAAKEIFSRCAAASAFAGSVALSGFQTDVLVNGKKSAVFMLPKT